MPYSIDNVPRPAKSWPEDEQRKCIRAANAVLNRGGSEQDAIFACIHAAGRSKKEGQEMTNARDRRRERRKAERDALRMMSDEEIEEVIEELEEEEPEVKKKDFIEEVSSIPERPFGGSESWDELDDYLDARDLANATRQATYEFDRLVCNVLENSETSLPDKSARITALAEGLPSRVESVEEESEEKSLLQKAIGILTGKAEMEARSINDLPDSDFGYVEPGGEKDKDGRTVPRSLRHYPIHDAAHVRNAIARATQMIKRGGKSAGIARKAMPRIRAAARKMNIGQFDKSVFSVFKDRTGGYRWIGLVTNKWRDRDKTAAPEKGGEIISEAAHLDMVKWANESPEKRMPQLMAWHSRDHRMKSRCDFLEYHDGFVIASGQLGEDEAGRIKTLSENHDMGMSHGMYVIKRDGDDPSVIEKYRTFEVSFLPLEHAANPWTDFIAVDKEIEMEDDRKQFLTELMGEEFVSELLVETEGKADQLEELGVESKAKKPKEEPTPEIQPEPQIPEPPDFKGLAESVIEAIGMKEMSAFMERLEKAVTEQAEQIAELKKSDDEKVAETLRPRINVEKDWAPVWKQRMSQSDDTVIEEKADLKGPSLTGGKLSWVTEVMGTKESAPIPK